MQGDEALAGENKKVKYVLTLTEAQAKICAIACEFYARIRMGQFNEITYHLMMEQDFNDKWCERRDIAESCLLAARKAIYPELGPMGHSFGIGKFDDADMSFDIYQVLCEKFPYDGRTPFSYCELPKCEVIEEGDV